ncbi:MAG: class II aldolase/adducin family protein [Steroidobacteraceae bacterium]
MVEESSALDLELSVLLVIEAVVAIQLELEDVAYNLEVLEQVGSLANPVALRSRFRHKIDLAACHRLAARFGFNEGIDNHLTSLVPGYSDRFYLAPFGLHWSEVRASDFMEIGFDGRIMAVAAVGSVACMVAMAVGSWPVVLASIFIYQVLGGASTPGVYAIRSTGAIRPHPARKPSPRSDGADTRPTRTLGALPQDGVMRDQCVCAP